MSLTIGLRGYPEALLAADEITLDLPRSTTASAVIKDLTGMFPQLRSALLHDDGVPRQSIRVLVGGVPVSHDSPVPASGTVTVLATLPCDG